MHRKAMVLVYVRKLKIAHLKTSQIFNMCESHKNYMRQQIHFDSIVILVWNNVKMWKIWCRQKSAVFFYTTPWGENIQKWKNMELGTSDQN